MFVATPLWDQATAASLGEQPKSKQYLMTSVADIACQGTAGADQTLSISKQQQPRTLGAY
jgi:hypothetical protein